MNKIGATVGHLVVGGYWCWILLSSIVVGFKHFQLDFNQIRTDNKAFIEYFRLNHQILSSLLKTPELIGMKNFSIQHRVLQRDRVLQRRLL